MARNPPQINRRYLQESGASAGFGSRWNCELFEDLADYNHQFKDTNNRHLDLDYHNTVASEGTVQVYTRFLGCWGAKGMTNPDIFINIFGTLDDIRVM